VINGLNHSLVAVLFSPLFVGMFATIITQKKLPVDYFHWEYGGIGRLWIREELIKFWKVWVRIMG